MTSCLSKAHLLTGCLIPLGLLSLPPSCLYLKLSDWSAVYPHMASWPAVYLLHSSCLTSCLFKVRYLTSCLYTADWLTSCLCTADWLISCLSKADWLISCLYTADWWVYRRPINLAGPGPAAAKKLLLYIPAWLVFFVLNFSISHQREREERKRENEREILRKGKKGWYRKNEKGESI